MARKKIKIPSLKDIQKKFPGQYIASQMDESKMPWLPTRCLAFNKITGGGIPFGKILELFGEESSGKTLLAYDFAYCAQYLGGIVLWVDAEQSFTNSWAEANGLDLTKVIVYRDTSIEKISDWIGMQALYWRSQLTHNEPILLVVDSVSALDTDNNIDSEMNNASADMGNRAKAIYKYFRIRNETLYSLGITQIYINQLRKNLKAGLFEDPDCLHYNTPVLFTDGSCKNIGDVVRNKISGKVWSLNEKTNLFEAKPISGWVEKEPTKVWYTITCKSPQIVQGDITIKCTPDHLVLTKRGWVAAKDLTLKDYLVSRNTNPFNKKDISNNTINFTRVLRISCSTDHKESFKYDLTIEGNHNFLAGSKNNGIIIHNTTPGGKALAFYAHIRVGMYGGKQITQKIKGKERKVGRVTSIRIKKNKVAAPGPTLKGTPIYNNAKYVDIGIDRLHFLDEILIEEGVIEKSKSGTYTFKGQTLCRGAEKFQDLLKNDDDLRRKLLKKAHINTLGSTKKLLDSLDTNLFPVEDSTDYDSEEETDD